MSRLLKKTDASTGRHRARGLRMLRGWARVRFEKLTCALPVRATPLARTGEFVETNQSDLGSPVPFAKIFRFTRRANHLYKFAPSRPTQGRIAIVTNAGWGAVDAAAFCARWDRRAGRKTCERSTARGREMLQRTAKSCGPDAPTLASSSRSCVGPTGLRQNLIRRRRWQKSPVTGESAT